MKIGIAITTRNRPDALAKSLVKHYEFLPSGAKLVIVDDASECGLPNVNDSFSNIFKFTTQVGVVTAKNKCLELLQDCEHIFLFDDDCYPICYYWYLYYTTSQLNHACMTFGRKVLNRNDNYLELEKPCGCMLYIRKICLDVIGGFDDEFKGYSYEHVNFSDRIFNAGLTPARYIDVPESLSILHSMDMYGEIATSFTNADKTYISPNYELYQQKFYSKEFKPFK